MVREIMKDTTFLSLRAEPGHRRIYPLPTICWKHFKPTKTAA